jgi:hypothetical protein
MDISARSGTPCKILLDIERHILLTAWATHRNVTPTEYLLDLVDGYNRGVTGAGTHIAGELVCFAVGNKIPLGRTNNGRALIFRLDPYTHDQLARTLDTLGWTWSHLGRLLIDYVQQHGPRVFIPYMRPAKKLSAAQRKQVSEQVTASTRAAHPKPAACPHCEGLLWVHRDRSLEKRDASDPVDRRVRRFCGNDPRRLKSGLAASTATLTPATDDTLNALAAWACVGVSRMLRTIVQAACRREDVMTYLVCQGAIKRPYNSQTTSRRASYQVRGMFLADWTRFCDQLRAKSPGYTTTSHIIERMILLYAERKDLLDEALQLEVALINTTHGQAPEYVHVPDAVVPSIPDRFHGRPTTLRFDAEGRHIGWDVIMPDGQPTLHLTDEEVQRQADADATRTAALQAEPWFQEFLTQATPPESAPGAPGTPPVAPGTPPVAPGTPPGTAGTAPGTAGTAPGTAGTGAGESASPPSRVRPKSHPPVTEQFRHELEEARRRLATEASTGLTPRDRGLGHSSEG